MPRASRYLVAGYNYHLTHRCHDRRFLLKFAKEREAYREWLRIGAQRYGVPVYGYCITSNHVHVIVHATDPLAIGKLMQLTHVRSQYPHRRIFEETSVGFDQHQDTWMLKEAPAAYTADSAEKSPV
jgi:REP element-mobilizing transposase RayT